MKVMMTCMSAAYVHHLLGSSRLELLSTMLQRGEEAAKVSLDACEKQRLHPDASPAV